MQTATALENSSPKHSPGTWRAIKWTSHAAVTVTVDDDQSITGKRVIAECDTEADALLIAASPGLLAMVRKMLSIETNAASSAELAALIAEAEGRC